MRERHVSRNYPKAFVWACEDDSLVPASNAKRFGEALEKQGIEHVLKVYPQGEHGCGLAYGMSAQGRMEEMLSFTGF